MTATLHEHEAHPAAGALAPVVTIGTPASAGAPAPFEIRALERGDGETLRRFYATLSDESRYRRFFQGVHDLPAGVLRHRHAGFRPDFVGEVWSD